MAVSLARTRSHDRRFQSLRDWVNIGLSAERVEGVRFGRPKSLSNRAD
jgi:hypothetical protein